MRGASPCCCRGRGCRLLRSTGRRLTQGEVRWEGRGATWSCAGRGLGCAVSYRLQGITWTSGPAGEVDEQISGRARAAARRHMPCRRTCMHGQALSGQAQAQARVHAHHAALPGLLAPAPSRACGATCARVSATPARPLPSRKSTRLSVVPALLPMSGRRA